MDSLPEPASSDVDAPSYYTFHESDELNREHADLIAAELHVAVPE